MHKLKNNGRCLMAFILGLILVGAAGCGSKFGEVKGTVSNHGKAVCSGTVLFLGSDQLPYYGTIDDDGGYTVPKVPAGPAKIAVFSPGPDAFKNVDALGIAPDGGIVKKAPPSVFRGDPKKWFPIPDEYQDFAKSRLTVTVTGGLNWHDIALD
jgi:hypothetical protein